MAKHKKKISNGRSFWFVMAGLIGLGFVVALLLKGNDVALMNPKGHIAEEQFKLIIVTMALMLEIAIPTLIAFYFIAWKYRESNPKATYDPHIRHSRTFVMGLWLIPSTMVILLAFIMWPATQKLEPKKVIADDTKPITIQVIAMRWKWLFLYTEQNIATVNYVQIPTDTPVRFELTADEAPMSSFWIPHLAGQLYAMTGHSNPIHVLAEEAGDYPGSSAEINGRGFAGMKFVARASSMEEFEAWVEEVRNSQTVLDAASYESLVEPSENHSVVKYSSYENDLYDKVLMKYGAHSGEHSQSSYEEAQH